MTKSVGIDLAIEHMATMGICFAEGMSQAAARLHNIEAKDEWQYEHESNTIDMVKVHLSSR